MSVVIFIPARYASSRYPGKPLVQIRGKNDGKKTLIQRTWEAARAVKYVDEVYVLTDDERIRCEASRIGAQVIMTSESPRNGTERCAEAIAKLDHEPEIVFNFQGDSPLTPAWFMEELIKTMKSEPEVSVATPVLKSDKETINSFLSDRKRGLVGGTTCVMNTRNDALYFSKEVLPYFSPEKAKEKLPTVYHHVGVYGYRPDALKGYMRLPQGRLERSEGLEQLRFLENSIHIRCVEVDSRGEEFWELNNPGDLARIERILQKR